MVIKPPRTRAQVEDYLRSFSYLCIGAWSIVFWVYTPAAFTFSLKESTVVLWTATTVLGMLMAMVGSIARLDVKLELPGIGVMLLGPLAYLGSQTWYSFVPSEGVLDPTQRYALAVFALALVAAHLPRIWALFAVVRQAWRKKKLTKQGMALIKKGMR